jgi:acetolactate synthase-1/2/3 large subunit
MALNGGDVVAKVLQQQGVSLVFTLCGGHISPILVGCDQIGLRVVDVRSEASAVFAAEATARITGIPGVAIVTAGPGVTNTITAVKNAQLAQVPVVLIGGASATVLKGRGALQDIDQVTLLKPIVKMAQSIRRNCDIVPVLEDAFTVARSGVPGPVFIECPIDLLYDEALVREWYQAGAQQGQPIRIKQKITQLYLKYHVDKMFACDLDTLDSEPHTADIPVMAPVNTAKAARLLDRAQTPVMIIGSQAMLHPDQTALLAEAVTSLGMPVYLAGMARGLMGPDHPLQMRHRRRDALKKADLVILAGMPCDFRLDYGRVINPQAALLAVNRSKKDLTLNRKPTLAVHWDPFLFLCALAQQDHARNHQKWQTWIDSLHAADRAREQEMVGLTAQSAEGVNPLVFFKKLDAQLGPSSILVADGGDFVATAAYSLRPRGPLQWLDPGVFGTLGVGGGFALGAKLTRPQAEVWLLYGDGSAGYTLQEFDTFVRHGLPVIAVVGNDAGWTQIARDQVAVLKNDVATVLRHADYHLVAQGYGGHGLQIESEDQIDDVLLQARKCAAEGQPVLINLKLAPTAFRNGSISV